ESGRGLKAPAERHQLTAGNVSLREPAAGRLGAVYIDVERRIVEILLDARIGDARHLAHVAQDLVGDAPVGLDVGAFDLNIDGRGENEVQDLREQVCRQEIERDAGKFAGQSRAQLADIIRGGAVGFL